jgi:hypothetical protein
VRVILLAIRTAVQHRVDYNKGSDRHVSESQFHIRTTDQEMRISFKGSKFLDSIEHHNSEKIPRTQNSIKMTDSQLKHSATRESEELKKP